jgi:hypothetical protein
MKKLFTLLLVLITCSVSAIDMGPYDPGAARDSLSNVTPATGRTALGLGTMAVATSTDYVATSALALRLDTTNASISNNLDVAGNVGAATVNGVAPLTAAERTQALVGSSTVGFAAKKIEAYGGAAISVLAGSTNTNTQTDSTDKIMRFGVPHYLAAEEPAAFALVESTSTDNGLYFGGATSQVNAATHISFWTSPNNTTTAGWQRMTIKGTGIINIAQTPTYADNAAAKSGGLTAGDIYRTSTGVLMIVY